MHNYTKPFFITGVAGFIGFHLARSLLDEGLCVVGFDSMSDYYDTGLKEARLSILQGYSGFTFWRADLEDRAVVAEAIAEACPEYIVHLAAQAGVRYSLDNPHAYVASNISGWLNLLEACRGGDVRHLLYASSSSVYSESGRSFQETCETDSPLSLYGVTKKTAEMMAQCYSRLYGLAMTGLRFFTVYGEWGRPDMALTLFAKSILRGEPITLFNYGEMQRDFTYIGDIVIALRKLLHGPVPSDSLHSLYNIGAGKPINLNQLVRCLEKSLSQHFAGDRTIRAQIRTAKLQAGDLQNTHANCDKLFRHIGYRPTTDLQEGIDKFVAWYKAYYHKA